MKILIAYDGSSFADEAIQGLDRAGLPAAVEARVLCVADVFVPPTDGAVEKALPEAALPQIRKARERVAQVLEKAREMADLASHRVIARFPQWKVSPLVCADSPAWAIIKEADKWKADLVVVGSQGHSAFGRLILGSVSQKVLTQASCSVRIGRGRVRKDPLMRLLVGVDGSPNSNEAVRAIAGRVWPAGSEVRMISALDLRMLTATGSIGPEMTTGTETAGETDWLGRIAGTSAESLRAAGLVASSLVQEGHPEHVLLDEAQKWEADCIFVGATGLGTLGRLLLGSVSAKVAARAHCSVEVIRHAPPGNS